MASLNWTMLSSTRQPLPLPHEKLIHSIAGVVLRVFPLPCGAPLSFKPPSHTVHKQSGTVHLSNKRIIFVSSSPATTTGAVAANDPHQISVDTFSVPYTHFHDGRFVQPWFGANYYEGSCTPAPGGGLDGLLASFERERESNSGPASIAVTYTFNEAGGYQFYETVEEMKQRVGDAAGSSTPQESLPLYTPPSSAAPLASASSLAQPTNIAEAYPIQTPGAQTLPNAERQQQDEDLVAACVASQAEQEEERTIALELDERPPSVNAQPGTHGRRIQTDMPPGYAP
ncbi:hypothetical protein OIV83_002330 [Microbotryomycetes sp. JL201]|nr:hypothetical protein OIV83_002330 [Microbotryomycetes sp. JL201]